MENLNIDAGAVSLTIDGDKNRVIRFYPTDVGFAESFYQLVNDYQTKAKELNERAKGADAETQVKLCREAFDTLREGIDRTFGEGTSQTVFGNRNSLSLFARFFRGITPYVAAARKQEIERYTSSASEVME